MIRKTTVLAVAATLGAMLGAGQAQADFTTTKYSSDAAFNAIVLSEPMVAEGRLGNNALNGTHEVDAGVSTGGPLDGRNFIWVSGRTVDFSVVFDGATQISITVTDSVAPRTVTASYTLPSVPNFNALGLRGFSSARGTGNTTWNNTSVLLDSLRLQQGANDHTFTETVSSSSALVTSSSVSNVDYLVIQGLTNAAFTLTGKATFRWEGGPPTNSNLAFQIKGINAVPEPSSVVALLTGAGVLGLVVRARRSAAPRA